MSNRLLEIAELDLSAAHDNLHRAQHAAKYNDPTKQWGQSGHTLNEIINDYVEWETKALAAVEQARKLGI